MLFWFPNENGKFDVSAEGIPAKTTIKISYTDRYKNQPTTATSLNSTLYYSLAPRNPKPQYTESKQIYKTFTKN